MRYAKFHDLTYLFDYVKDNRHYKYSDLNYIPSGYSEEYYNKVNEYLKNQVFEDGDIVFTGSTYESRQYYGFASIENHEMVSTIFDCGDFLEIPGVYYKKAIEDMNKFWMDFEGGELVGEYYIKRMKENGTYDIKE